jgi:hypothetical protein
MLGHNLHNLNLKMVLLREKRWHTVGHSYPIELKFHNRNLCHQVHVAYDSLPLFMIIYMSYSTTKKYFIRNSTMLETFSTESLTQLLYKWSYDCILGRILRRKHS